MTDRERRRAALVRIGRIGDVEGADAFDRDFWARVLPAERLAAVWDMVLDHLLLTRPDEAERGLQRSLCRVERAWAGRVETAYGDVSVPVIGRRELVEIKRRVGRPQDLEDAARLESLD